MISTTLYLVTAILLYTVYKKNNTGGYIVTMPFNLCQNQNYVYAIKMNGSGLLTL